MDLRDIKAEARELAREQYMLLLDREKQRLRERTLWTRIKDAFPFIITIRRKV